MILITTFLYVPWHQCRHSRVFIFNLGRFRTLFWCLHYWASKYRFGSLTVTLQNRLLSPTNFPTKSRFRVQFIFKGKNIKTLLLKTRKYLNFYWNNFFPFLGKIAEFILDDSVIRDLIHALLFTSIRQRQEYLLFSVAYTHAYFCRAFRDLSSDLAHEFFLAFNWKKALTSSIFL